MDLSTGRWAIWPMNKEWLVEVPLIIHNFFIQHIMFMFKIFKGKHWEYEN